MDSYAEPIHPSLADIWTHTDTALAMPYIKLSGAAVADSQPQQ